ncbi:MAG TPA: S8 family serine peptidase [Rhizomicrobium sp.]|nr:S8 family serine peptidase [Rhizomicrobium sp.]
MRNRLLTAAAAVCLTIASSAAIAQATDQGGPITPYYGTDGGPVDPFYGPINPFYGGTNQNYGVIGPLWGDISSFWGTVNPFYGSVDPFYGDTDPFWGTVNPFNVNPFRSTLYSYWSVAAPQWGALNLEWNLLQQLGSKNYLEVQIQLAALFASADLVWGPNAQTLGNQMLAKYGIDPKSQASLAAATPEMRSAFYLNWYDALMTSIGVDDVDWWMASAQWAPELALTNGTAGTRVGLLDATTTGADSDVKRFHFIGGYAGYVDDHGAAVGSLIAAQEDGTGVMGVAPKSVIGLYDPFDQTGTGSWQDVAAGIDKLDKKGNTVINASLGVPGWTLSADWGPILASLSDNFVLVKAAGNEAVQQTTDISWPSGANAPDNLLIVGSAGPTNTISDFSNTPGEACILINNVCQEQNKLKYRFLVAPGELMLVEDNHGGVTRMTGTSFAAPLVTGTISLLQSRWPQLRSHPAETVQILLQSATDLGAPGVDPVYGWGMLNVEAAQSPLNFDNLTVFQPFIFNGNKIQVDPQNPNWTPAELKAAIQTPGQLATWNNEQAFLVVYENIGATYRDFVIPLSSKLVTASQNVNGSRHRFQAYIYQRLLNWATGLPRHRHHHKR